MSAPTGNRFTWVEGVLLALLLVLSAVIAYPFFLGVKQDTKINQCLGNMRMLERAMRLLELDKNKPFDANVTMADILPYLKGELIPVCPSSGKYKVTNLKDPPTCSIAGHSMANDSEAK